MAKRNSVDQASSPQQAPMQQQQRRGLPWKGKGKSKGHWALQPPSSSLIISDVIEISAANTGSASVRDEEEENERRERERLREAAAESIGISPLFREDASSRLAGNDSMRFEDESVEEDVSGEGIGEVLEDDQVKRGKNSDRSRTSINGTMKPNGLQLQQLQIRESRHHRSSSLSGLVTPTTPSSTNWHHPFLSSQTVNTNGRAPTPLSSSAVQPYLPSFPCFISALDPFTKKASTLLKHFPSSSLLILGLSRQWRSRFLVMTAPPTPRSATSFNGLRPFTPSERVSPVIHLHLFKSSATDERELERLEINEDSVVFVAEEEIAGKRSVVKVGGIDVGGKKRELNVEENGQTLWFLSIFDTSEAQSWIATLKSTVLDQRAERAGFGMPTQSTASGPRGDLDVMLSMRAQDVASTVRTHAHTGSTLSNSLQEEGRARGASSPTPTIRSWSGDGRPSSPGRMVTLKGLFSVPGRARSLSHGTIRGDDPPKSPDEPSSFASRGTTLLNMIRSSGGNSVGTDSMSVPTSLNTVAHTLPGPILPASPILSVVDMNLDKPSTRERDRELPEWYSIQQRQHSRGDSRTSLNAGPSLLPPPRRRPWTSAGLSNVKQEQPPESNFSSRKSFQDTVSLVGGRLSLEEKTRSQSPVDSLGTAPGVFGTPELGSRRASLSSSVSSFVSSPADRDQLLGRSNSVIQRRIRVGKVPKMLSPPAGPPPSVPAIHSQLSRSTGSISADRNSHTSAGDRPPSRSSSIRSTNASDVMQHVPMSRGRRLSTSSALSLGSASTSQSLVNNVVAVQQVSPVLPSKRASMPPPPRPAPTFALPPTPSVPKQNGSPTRRTFRESFSHKSLRFSLTPPPTKSHSPRFDESIRRRSHSNGSSVSNSASFAGSIPAPVPPPTGPLPPTPQELPIINRYSFRERLRMKSAPSTPSMGTSRVTSGPPTSFPGSPPLVTVASVASLKDPHHSVSIGEPITSIPKDFNFLNMSTPIEATAHSSDDLNFLNMSSPFSATFPVQIPPRSAESPPPEHVSGSPPTPEMTVLPPPPRRSRNGTISEKDRNHSSQSLSNSITPAAVDNVC
ncbi:hypothetical protein DFH11DRAFT_209191 [Phellopilus nigrolimitatus]|nr:hypothetical protein DFH11DRAFT_209191 [Phellopilus nigrolimitatus]